MAPTLAAPGPPRQCFPPCAHVRAGQGGIALSDCVPPQKPVVAALAPWQHMTMARKRRVFEQGHLRKFLVIVDESTEVESALFFAASRVAHAGGMLLLLYVIEPQDYQHWAGVRQVQIDEETNKAKALFRLFRRKLNQEGFQDIAIEEVILEGKTDETIVRLINDDEDIAILVLGAASDAKGPGPLVSSLAVGKLAGTFPIPITIVPGDLHLEEIRALA
jgi:nucleotide-binding universal stress UspA family protein